MWPIDLKNVRWWIVAIGLSGLLVGFMLGRVWPAKYTVHRIGDTYLHLVINENTGEVVGVYGPARDGLPLGTNWIGQPPPQK